MVIEEEMLEKVPLVLEFALGEVLGVIEQVSELLERSRGPGGGS